MNNDGVFTISDIWHFIAFIFYLPGDFLILVILSMPAFATFFEFSEADYQGAFSGFIAICFWLCIYFLIRNIYRAYSNMKSLVHKRIENHEKRSWLKRRKKLGYDQNET